MDSLSVGSAVFIVRDSNGSFVDRDAVSFPSSSLFFSEAKAVFGCQLGFVLRCGLVCSGI